jgi:hypothetical protein
MILGDFGDVKRGSCNLVPAVIGAVVRYGDIYPETLSENMEVFAGWGIILHAGKYRTAGLPLSGHGEARKGQRYGGEARHCNRSAFTGKASHSCACRI